MRKTFFLSVVVVCTLAQCSVAATYHISDTGLAAAIAKELGKKPGTTSFTTEDLERLTNLTARFDGIRNLWGLQYAKNLETLDLSDNWISDITWLSRLTKLTSLYLGFNQISDLSALAGLGNLAILNVAGNPVSTLSPLSGLTGLSTLYVSSSQVSDLSPLAGLADLSMLYVLSSQVSDLSPLTGLTKLSVLHLDNNQISDLSPLTGLTLLGELNLGRNPLSAESCYVILPQIVANNPRAVIAHDTCPQIAPGVGTDAPNITEDNVTLNGYLIHNGGQPTEVRFCYRVQGQAPQYTLWRSIGGSGPFSETISGLDPGTRYEFYAEAHNASGTVQGNTVSFDTLSPTVVVYTLSISSGNGGTVNTPGVGSFSYDTGSVVSISATAAADHDFVNWTGTAVDAGKVANPYTSATTVTLDGDYTLHANFRVQVDDPTGGATGAEGRVYYVDDDAPSDPGPNDPGASDPAEDGSVAHPFDMIQEAIDAAVDGQTVKVRSGTYWETIDFKGKRIRVTGSEPNQPAPVIDGNYLGTVATFANGEDPNTELSGFILTRGQGDIAGGILCSSSHPLIANCLIVGNRTLNALEGGGGAYCFDSNAVFANCTFSGNYGGAFGAGFFSDSSHNEIVNSILWDNSPFEILFPFLGNSAPPVVTYSDIASGAAGSGNMSLAPSFVLPGYWADPLNPSRPMVSSDPDAIWVAGDYHLASLSPCIDSGDPNHARDPNASDCDGESRIYGNRIDMGADEFVPAAIAPSPVANYGNTSIPLALDPNAPDPNHTLLGHVPIAMDLNFKVKLIARATSASVAGGTWTAWLIPDVLGPGSDLATELWVKGEGVDMELLPAEPREIVLAHINILAAPAQ